MPVTKKKNRMKISIIIVNYNVKYYLEQCLLSLREALHDIDSEIIVVDNDSADDSVRYITKRFPEVKCISLSDNLGFACANNIAIKQVNSDYVLLLNPDTFVSSTTIKEAIKFLDKHTDVGALGVKMLNPDGSCALESRRGFPTPMVALYKFLGLCRHYPHHPKFAHYYMGKLPWNKPCEIEVISGAFFMSRTNILREIGYLDEDFFMYGEDIDLSYRVNKQGYKNYYLPYSILHYKGESTKKSSYRYVHVFYKAMLIFFRKHYGGMSVLLSVPIQLAIYLRATLSLLYLLYTKLSSMIGLFNPQKNKSKYNYIFIGSQKSMDNCKKIMKQRGLIAKFFIGDNINLPNGHKTDNIISAIKKNNSQYIIVYDIEAYSFTDILSIFSSQPLPNVFIGTYNNGCIITPYDVFK